MFRISSAAARTVCALSFKHSEVSRLTLISRKFSQESIAVNDPPSEKIQRICSDILKMNIAEVNQLLLKIQVFKPVIFLNGSLLCVVSDSIGIAQ